MDPHPRVRRILCSPHRIERVSFRPADNRDVDRIGAWLNSEEAQRHIHLLPEVRRHARRRVLEWIDEPQGLHLVVQFDNSPTGFLQLEHFDELRRQVWLSLIVVDPARIGQGVGTAALRHLLGRIRETESIDRILLAVDSDNARAVRAYRRVGFVPIDRNRYRLPYEGRDIDQYIMECAVHWHAPSVCRCDEIPHWRPAAGT
jgi:RimJ/RimL family protein N-acetyltransferase